VKIQCLELINFRNHSNTFMVFDKVNYIVGNNNSGKSTIKGALQYAITGENEWAVSGRQSKDLIKHNEREASVEVEIDGLGLVKRIIRGSGNYVELNNSRLPNRELEKEIFDDFKLTNEMINCVILSSKFLEMKPSEQKDFLFRLTGAMLEPGQIIRFMDKPSEKAKDVVRKRVRGKVSIEDLDRVYKTFFDERRLKKRERERLATNLEAMGEVPSESGVDISAITKLLEEKTKNREDLMKKIAVINERINHEKWLKETLEGIERKIKAIDEKVDKSIVISDAEEILFGYVTEANSLEKGIEKCRAIFNTLNGQTKSLKAMLPKLTTTQCPLSEKLVCKTDKSSLIEDLKSQIKGNEDEMKKQQEKESALQNQLEDINKKKDNLKLQIDLAAQLEDLQRNREEIVKALESVKIDDKSLLTKEIEKYEVEIKELEEKRQAYNDWVRAKKSYEDLKKELEQATEEVEIYEYLVAEFSPKGVKQRILEKIIEPIQKHCNKTLSILTDGLYKLEFSFDGEFDILIENKSGKVSHKLLSSSEKQRIGIVIQDAINNLTNANLLFVDDAEMLDDDNFQLLEDLITKLKDKYDSIFVIATTGDESKMASLKKEDSKVFLVADGAVREI
jgi:DNA repair exonuclease SbcCD ATPase subunit